MIVLDTSVAYALLDRRDQLHERAVAWYAAATEELVTTPFVLAEIDHLARVSRSPGIAHAFRQDVQAGAYAIDWWDAAAAEAAAVAESYTDLGLSIADASLVCLAARVNTEVVATFDQRHFRAIRPLTAGSFRLVPADA